RKKYFKVGTLLSLVVLIAGIAFSYMGEGRALRLSALPHHDFGTLLLITGKSLVITEYEFIREKYLWIILFFFAWMGFAERISLSVTFRPSFVLKMLAAYIV